MIDIDALALAYQEEWDRIENEDEVRDYDQRTERRQRRAAARDKEMHDYRLRVTAMAALLGAETYKPTGIVHWLKHDTWTVNEGLVLLSGFHPTHMHFSDDGDLNHEPEDRYYAAIKRLDGLAINTPEAAAVGGERIEAVRMDFFRHHGRLRQVWKSGDHDQLRYGPKYFIDWAQGKDFAVPWLAWAIEHGHYPSQDRNARDQTAKNCVAMDNRERETLFKIVLGMAIRGYSYDPKAGRSTVVGDIVEDLKALGIDVSDDTVRKYLKLATETIWPSAVRQR